MFITGLMVYCTPVNIMLNHCMRRTFVIIGLISQFYSAYCQQNTNSKAVDYAATITSQDLSKHLHILADDKMQGRETGQKGQKMAANYIAGEFFDYGLLPVVATPDNTKSYYQSFDLIKRSWGEVYVQTTSQRREFLKDF